MSAQPLSDPTPTEPRGTGARLDLGERLPRYLTELAIGVLLAALVLLALVATVGSVPFIYQGF
jgi:hypothetical protein